jgi:SAM-dependent methyltransferase
MPSKLKTFARSAERFARRVLTPRAYMRSTFAPFYTDNRWGDDESVSGPGSSVERTAKLRRELPGLLQAIGARTLLDAPCGDFNWMKDAHLDVERYIGADVIPDLIARNQELYANDKTQFVLLDVTRDKLPRVDVILCRDCLIHFSYRHIVAAVRNFKRSGSTYLLTNSYPAWLQNENIRTGDFRPLNLTLPPFNFPPPLRQIHEKLPEEEARFFGKILGLWKLSDLSVASKVLRRGSAA